MKLVFTDHLKTRLKQRKISSRLVRDVFKQDAEKYWDKLRDHHIIVGNISYKGATGKVLIAYDKIDETLEIITIHTITEVQIKQRLSSGRWIYEEHKTN